MSNTQASFFSEGTEIEKESFIIHDEPISYKQLNSHSYGDYEEDASPTDSNERFKTVKHFPYLTTHNPLRGNYKWLQQWEGIIIEIRKNEIEAKIKDKTDPSLPDELVVFDKDELSPDDLIIAKSGSVFYWSIGYVDYPGRGRVRESRIRIRRLKGWSKTEIDEAKSIASDLAKLFNSNSD